MGEMECFTASSRPINSFTRNALSRCDNNTTAFWGAQSSLQRPQSAFLRELCATTLEPLMLFPQKTHWDRLQLKPFLSLELFVSLEPFANGIASVGWVATFFFVFINASHFPKILRFRVEGLGFRSECLGFRYEGLGFKVEGLGLRV